MKRFLRILAAFVFAAPVVAAHAAVPPSATAGSNLTAWNGSMGSANNNAWNGMANGRNSQTASAPKSDFGNCNALIMRCAQPKCAGCTTMDLAVPIVSGCVQSTASCKQYGDELVQYMAAQLVANASANMAAAETAAAQAAAYQSQQQLEQMQYQMQQMQADMANQNAQAAAQLQEALAAQQQMTAQAIADATAAAQAAAAAAATPAPVQQTAGSVAEIVDNGLTAAQTAAAQSGVSSDILVREQITGQIYTAIENAELAMKALKTTMGTVFDYAGCDSRGNNCTGPKRVKVFKERAMQFFDPYENVLDEIYDALILAQSVGVDITDIYMMLNGTCNVWGQYMCQPGQIMHYNSVNCSYEGKSVPQPVYDEKCTKDCKPVGYAPRGGATCKVGQIVPMADGGCQLIRMLTDTEEVQRNWLYPDKGESGADVRVGCASEALDNSFLFRNRKKQATIDIETLQRIIEQDAPAVFGSGSRGKKPYPDGIKYCAISTEDYQKLQSAVSLKKLPGKICVADGRLEGMLRENTTVIEELLGSDPAAECMLPANKDNKDLLNDSMCLCVLDESGQPSGGRWNQDGTCSCPTAQGWVFDTGTKRCKYDASVAQKVASDTFENALCRNYGGEPDPDDGKCDCRNAAVNSTYDQCVNYATNGHTRTITPEKLEKNINWEGIENFRKELSKLFSDGK